MSNSGASQNALDVLFSALPSDVASSLHIKWPQVSSTASTPGPTTLTSIRTSSSSPASITSHTSSSTTRSNVLQTSISSVTQPPPSQTSTSRSSTSSLSQGAAAGIAAGVIVAFGLLILAIVLIIRKIQNGRAFPKKGYAKPDDIVYPEVAWLYDPELSPARKSRPGTAYKRGIQTTDFARSASPPPELPRPSSANSTDSLIPSAPDPSNARTRRLDADDEPKSSLLTAANRKTASSPTPSKSLVPSNRDSLTSRNHVRHASRTSPTAAEDRLWPSARGASEVNPDDDAILPHPRRNPYGQL